MITSCLLSVAWCFSSTAIAYHTKFWISLYIQSHFNPLQNHSAEHLVCHVMYHDVMQFFAAARSPNERGRRHNINEDFYIVVLRLFHVER